MSSFQDDMAQARKVDWSELGITDGKRAGSAYVVVKPEGLAERLREGLAQLVYRSHVPDPRWKSGKVEK